VRQIVGTDKEEGKLGGLLLNLKETPGRVGNFSRRESSLMQQRMDGNGHESILVLPRLLSTGYDGKGEKKHKSS